MMNQKIIHFNSIVDLQESINEQIKDLDDKIGLHSKLIGDKIREGEKNNSEELTDLKNKLNPEKNKEKKGEDKKSKTKKTTPKKKLKKESQKTGYHLKILACIMEWELGANLNYTLNH